MNVQKKNLIPMELPIINTSKKASKIHEFFRKSKDWIYIDNCLSLDPNGFFMNGKI